MGFKPDAPQGDMFDKKYYGLKVPKTEDYDYQNTAKLETKNKHISGESFKDGFTKIDKGKIPPAVQDQFLDSGEVKKPYPSCTSTGYNRKKHGLKRGRY